MTSSRMPPDSDISNPDQWRSAWRHLRLSTDSPELTLADGITARIAMTQQATVAKVLMAADAVQPDFTHVGDSFIVVLDGELHVETDGAVPDTVAMDGVAVLAAGRNYTLTAGPQGCTRMDVFVPPNMTLAEAAFHQEHAGHGFE